MEGLRDGAEDRYKFMTAPIVSAARVALEHFIVRHVSRLAVNRAFDTPRQGVDGMPLRFSALGLSGVLYAYALYAKPATKRKF